MKKLLLLSCMLVVAAAVIQGRPVPRTDAGWSAAVEEKIVQAQPKELKPYYPKQAIADLCEDWPSCADWAEKQYQINENFRIVKIGRRSVFKSAWHTAGYRQYLYVQAVVPGKTINVMFT